MTDDGARAVALTSLALSYQFSGQPDRLVLLFRRHHEIRKQQDNKRDQEIGLTNLGEVLLEIGALREALGAFWQALALSRELEDTFREAASLLSLGRVLGTTGDPVLSRVALGRSQRLFANQGESQGEGFTTAYLAECSLWFKDFAQASALADRA